MLGAGKVIAGLVLLAIIAYGLYTISNPGTTTFSGDYISFEYQKDLNVTIHDVDLAESSCESVVLKDKEGEHMVSFFKNVPLEDVEYNVSSWTLGVADKGNLGDVEYTQYYLDEPPLYLCLCEGWQGLFSHV